MMAETWTQMLLPTTGPWFSGQSCCPWPDRHAGGGIGGDAWTTEENKVFEKVLALIDRNAPDRWEKVASMLPSKTVADVMNHYNDLENDVGFIEAGLVSFPHYSSSPPSSGFTLDHWDGSDGGFRRGCGLKRGRGPGQERRKGVPWTEDEHKLFLQGLRKYGRGYWRNIALNFVTTRTPTQVASHAQKYFIRLQSGGKDKRRPSIHDTTTANLSLPNDDHGNISPSPSSALNTASNPTGGADQFGALTDVKPFIPPFPGVAHPYANVKLGHKSSLVSGLGFDDSVLLQIL